MWKDNYQVYGLRKLWKTARRAGIEIGRDQTAQLTHQAGIQGVLGSKRVRTTRRDVTAGRHPDLVGRQFTASNPNELWVTDLTFVLTWAGGGLRVLHRGCVLPADRWRRVAGHMRTPMVLDAIEMARCNRGCATPSCGVTQTPARSSRPFATASAWRRSARPRRSDRSATAMTTPWPRQ